jgi:hypothetical protein
VGGTSVPAPWIAPIPLGEQLGQSIGIDPSRFREDVDDRERRRISIG